MVSNEMFIRQQELFDRDTFGSKRVGVIGLGATGSWVATILNKLGVMCLTLADHDIIEAHNVPNQAYDLKQVGKFKAPMLAQKLDKELTVFLNTHIQKIETRDEYIGLYHLMDTMFCLVDSMQSRKNLLEYALSAGATRYWVETRMGLTGYRVYIIDLHDEEQVEKYKTTFYLDEEAIESACGTSSSVITTAMQCASHAVGLWLSKLQGNDVPMETIVDIHTGILMSRKGK